MGDIYKKLLVQEPFKVFEIMEVSKECFDNSPNCESMGFITGFKIHSDKELNFKIDELKRLNFVELEKEIVKGGSS